MSWASASNLVRSAGSIGAAAGSYCGYKLFSPAHEPCSGESAARSLRACANLFGHNPFGAMPEINPYIPAFLGALVGFALVDIHQLLPIATKSNEDPSEDELPRGGFERFFYHVPWMWLVLASLATALVLLVLGPLRGTADGTVKSTFLLVFLGAFFGGVGVILQYWAKSQEGPGEWRSFLRSGLHVLLILVPSTVLMLVGLTAIDSAGVFGWAIGVIAIYPALLAPIVYVPEGERLFVLQLILILSVGIPLAILLMEWNEPFWNKLLFWLSASVLVGGFAVSLWRVRSRRARGAAARRKAS